MIAFNEEEEDQYDENYRTGSHENYATAGNENYMAAGDHKVPNSARQPTQSPAEFHGESPEIFDYLDNSNQFDAMLDAQRNTVQLRSQDFFDDSYHKAQQDADNHNISSFDDGFKNQNNPSYILPPQAMNS